MHQPPPIKAYAADTASTSTLNQYAVGDETARVPAAHPSGGDGTKVFYDSAEPTYMLEDGTCTGYLYGPCTCKVMNLSYYVWSEGGSGNQYGSTSWAYWTVYYTCLTCGYEGKCTVDPYSYIPTCVQQKCFSKSSYHETKSMISAYKGNPKSIHLCTANLYEHVHSKDNGSIEYYKKVVTCSCGNIVGEYTFARCKECGKEFTQGVTHNQGSQTSSGCGYSVPAPWVDHTVLEADYCSYHHSNKVHWYIEYASHSNSIGVHERPASDYDAIPDDPGYLVVGQGSAYYCSACNSIVTGQHESINYSPQKSQVVNPRIVYAGGTVTSIEYALNCIPGIATDAETTCTYTSSNTSVAGDFSSTGLFKVKGVGTTVITVNAEETSSYAAATGSVSLTVTKGNLVVAIVPTASSISYGQSLASSALLGGVVNDKSKNSVGGTWSWKSPTSIPSAGKQTFIARYTPTDTLHYEY